MEWVHWLFVFIVAVCVGLGWAAVVRPMQHRGWKSLNDRMAAQVTQSAELLGECAGDAPFAGRRSTIL
jgi:hypothetical protein